MARAWLAGVGLALLAPLALAESVHGDDWAGQLAFTTRDALYLYEFEGVGCGLPMWCWELQERFSVSTSEGLWEVPGSAAWTSGMWGPYNTYHQLHGDFVFNGVPVEVTWHAVLHSVCYGVYEGPVRPDTLLLDQAGRGSATRTGPGPDGQYECMPS